VRNNLPLTNVYKKKNIKSEITTQLLYGDNFKKIKKNRSWLKIKNNTDNYEGFIENKNFPIDKIYTHKVYKLKAELYSRPSAKNIIKKKLSFGSKIRVTLKKKNYYKFDNLWIHKKNLKKKKFQDKNIFKNIKKFSNIKYKWGGKHFGGIDCSGLVQILLNFNNKFCPRDTKDQIKYFKKKVKLENIKKNDLIFWKGHVAIAISKSMLMHAYGPKKRTVAMRINKTIQLIYKSTGLKVIGIRRIS